MAVIRPFALPQGGLLVQLLSLGPGLCGGDTMRLDVTAGPGTRVIVTTTAATRVMSMDPDISAEQHVFLRAGVSSALEYYPCITLPYPGSAFVQTIAADAADGARVGLLECWGMGRAARSEYLQFRSLSSRTTVSIDGVVRYADAIHLDPQATDLASVALLAGRRYVAAGVWSGVTLGEETTSGGAIQSDPLVAFAQSAPGFAYLRAIGHDGPSVDAALHASVDRVSRCWGLPGVRLDRFHS